MVKEGYKEVRVGPRKVKLPINWETSKIKELLKIKSGYAFKSDDYVEDGIFMVRVTNINDNGEIKKGNGETKYLPEEYLEEYKKYQLEDNDILLVMVGASTGKIGKVDSDVLPAILNQNMWNLKPKDDSLDKPYFYYSILKEINRFLSMKIGSARSYIKKGDFKKFEIPLPPLPEQKKIASILSSVDKSIEKTDEVIEETKELKKGLMQELLTKGIGHSEFKEVELGPNIIEIPASWDFRQIDDISTKVVDGVHSTPDYTESGIPFITTTNLTSGQIDFSDCKYISEKAHKKLVKRANPEKGDILFTKVGTLGITDVIDFEKEFSIFVQLALIKLKDNYDPFYYKYLLNSALIRGRVKSISAGSTLKYIGVGQIKNLFILVPPLEEQKKIASILSSADAKIQKEEEYKSKLERLKKGLMQKLLTGEIRTNTDMEV